METTEVFSHWAIVELFGHAKYAGNVIIGSTQMFELTVPETEQNGAKLPAFIKYIHINAIYAITLVSEEYARQMATQLKKQPVEIEEYAKVIREMSKGTTEQMTLGQIKKMIESGQVGRSSAKGYETIASKMDEGNPF